MALQTVLDELRNRPGTGETIPVIDPATEEQITEFRDCGSDAVDEAVAAAKTAYQSGVWTDIPARRRAKVLWRLGDLIDEHATEFAELESLDAGMPPMQAEMIVATCAEFFRYYAGWCTKLNGSSYHAYTTKEPYGVVGLIYPWNGPLFNACAKIAPALAAGCSSIVKPAEETPLSAVLLERLIAQAGVPDGVTNFVIGYGATAGAAITAHPDVEKVAFTGSTEVGKQIMRDSADNLKKVTLELGGKSPVLIYEDADLDMAIMMASMGIFVHSGQGCVCGSRIFVQRSVYERVVAGIAMIGDNLVLGGPKDEGAMISPLVSQKQLDRVLGYIDQASATAPKSSPAVTDWTEKVTSSSPPWSPMSTQPPAGCIGKRSSARWLRSCRSTTTRKPSRWPTTPATAWLPRSGPPTWLARTVWASACRPAWSG
ncbi:aldehyde dehydrogenase [Mycolicibacterium conceptionense]|uniref:Aldehyde dehydrogenase n=1 Tax=Mycolicibacterium conceptionense TaxID=451644 RepID=A0A0U1DG82_9MYCO|nr:aldehyde dehydrogenase [Mycolicibacterium conceptionense]